jgi:hypothetical protein
MLSSSRVSIVSSLPRLCLIPDTSCLLFVSFFSSGDRPTDRPAPSLLHTKQNKTKQKGQTISGKMATSEFVCPICSELSQLERIRKAHTEKRKKAARLLANENEKRRLAILASTCPLSSQEGEGQVRDSGIGPFATKQWLSLPPSATLREYTGGSILSVEQKQKHALWAQGYNGRKKQRMIKRAKKTDKEGEKNSGSSNAH